MKKKIFGILICTLFIGAGALPCISGNIIENTPPSSPKCFYDWHNYTLVVSSTDKESDQIRYGLSWFGDSIVDVWTEYYPSGVEAIFEVKGQKESVDIVAEDIYGARSPMVNTLPPGKSIGFPILNSFFEILFEHLSSFEKILNQYYYN